jgi:ATP-binding cassette subfamily B protein
MSYSSDFTFSFSYLLGLMRKYKGGIILIIILNVLWSVFQICIPFLTKALVDSGIENKDVNIIVTILIAQFILFIGITISDVFRKWLLRHIGVRINLLVIVNFLGGIVKKPFTFFNVKEQGKTIQHFNDNLRIEAFLTNNTSDFFNAMVKLIIYAFLLFIFSTKLGFIFLAFNVGLMIWISIFLRTRKKVDEHRFAISSLARTELIELFTGIIDLKSYNQEKSRVDSWDNVQSKFSDLRLNLLRINQVIYGGVNSLAQIRDILIIFFAAMATVNGQMTLGTLLAIQYILGQLNDPVNQLLEFVPQYQDARLSLNRINEAMAIEEEGVEKALSKRIPERASIKIENVSFGYSNQFAIEDISLEIPYARSIAILGESGSGKSTLIRLMLKLIRAETGRIFLDQTDFHILDQEAWRENCGIVLQESMLFNRSVLYNITFQEDRSQVDVDRVYHCLEQCKMLDVINNLPDGLESIVGQSNINFSKGQAQRILLSRALYRKVDYYFLDEPFSALDRSTYRKVFRNIREMCADKTLVIVTHKMEVAKKMDKIYLLEKGKIIESGTHEQLSKLGRRYTKIFLSDDDD